MRIAQNLLRFLPFRDLKGLSGTNIQRDLQAALSVMFMSVPQGIAYALIAGLPPAMGLYAGALPAIFGSLFRSSKHVVTGPTNALSLLVGTAVAASVGSDPIAIAATLALIVGLFQLIAGLMNLGALVDYISSSVVLGYITGAGILIGAGQLGNITGTELGEGYLFGQISGWVATLGQTDPKTLVLAVGTALLILLVRRLAPRSPAAILAIGVGIALSWLLDLSSHGLATAGDLAPVPVGLPPLTVPSVANISSLWSMAVALTVLSLVESNAVARSIAGRTGQRIDASVEFAGQGIANLAAGFFGGYPVSGSLSRSAMNEKMGAQTRLAGALSGVGMLAILLFLGPLVDLTPIASLAGLVLVIAIDLIDIKEIQIALQSRMGDRLAFILTLVGTWTLPLDKAIYLGIFISLVLYLRRVRLLTVRDLVVDERLHLREVLPEWTDEVQLDTCPAIRVLHVEGSLFFGAANELRSALDGVLADSRAKVLVLRLKRASGLDYTSASVLEGTYRRMAKEDRSMLLVGMTPQMMTLIRRTGMDERIKKGDLYPTQPGWFAAMNEAITHAIEIVGEHECGAHCPLERYLLHTEELETNHGG